MNGVTGGDIKVWSRLKLLERALLSVTLLKDIFKVNPKRGNLRKLSYSCCKPLLKGGAATCKTRWERILSLMKKIYRCFYYKSPFSIGILEIPMSICIIRNAKLTVLDDILDFVYTFKILELNIKPAQVREEIRELLSILDSVKPKNILEIGTAYGGTLFLFCRVASYDATIISIDLPGGPFGGGYPIWKIPLYRSFARKGQKLYLIRADSHNPETLKTVEKILGERKLDFLFIDGDHTYEGVKKDFEMYFPLVRRGGIIAFHDIIPGPPENVGEVPKFWVEIKNIFRHAEIVKDWKQGGYGIGVIYV